VPARLINIKYITIRAEKVASPVTALQSLYFAGTCAGTFQVASTRGDSYVQSRTRHSMMMMKTFFTVCLEHLLHLAMDSNANNQSMLLLTPQMS